VRQLVLLLGSHEQRARTVLAEAAHWLQDLSRPAAVLVSCPCPKVRALALDSLASVPGAKVVAVDAGDPVRAHAGLVAELVARRDDDDAQDGFLASRNSSEPDPARHASSVNPMR
jgi:hypothetical protein